MTWHEASLAAPSRLARWWHRLVHPRSHRGRRTVGGVLLARATLVGECRDCGGVSLRVRTSDLCYFCAGRRWQDAAVPSPTRPR